MRKSLARTILYFWFLVLITYVVGLQYLFFSGSIGGMVFSPDYNKYYVFIDLIIFSLYFLYIYIFGSFKNKDLFKIIPLLLANLSCLLLIFLSSTILFNYIAIILLSLAILLLSQGIIKAKDESNSFLADTSLFIIAFTLVFNFLVIFYNSLLPYWAVSILVTILLVLIMIYRFLSSGYSYKNLFVLLSATAVIIFEVIVYSFFWPIKSLLIKSLIVWLIYYLLTGIFTIILKDAQKRKLVVYFSVFILIFILLFAYLIFRGVVK
ncbi:MAG TPA: hypothetical protein P5096_00390 [Patescibacteria group bacterium]|nr:hypothetical protein [Patescibacteria group bacterium]